MNSLRSSLRNSTEDGYGNGKMERSYGTISRSHIPGRSTESMDKALVQQAIYVPKNPVDVRFTRLENTEGSQVQV
jgi:hypothetical protein